MANIKKTILIVEDEAPLLRILKDTLGDEGFRVFAAADGKEGLELAETHVPDFILLDIVMPRTNGMVMLRKLRESDWGKGIPVLILTNLNNIPTVINRLEFESAQEEDKAEAQKFVAANEISSEKARNYIKQYLEGRLKKGVYDFLIKADCSLEDIVDNVKEIMSKKA